MSKPAEPLAATGPNAEQIEYWNSDAGERWARNQDRLDAMLHPFSDAMVRIAAPKTHERALDIGCGCGATTLALDTHTGASGRALGIDISAPMIARARERALTAGSTAEFMLADAATHAFEPGAFDILTSRFGIMFFLEPVAAFAHMRKALTPEGRIAFICWRPMKENPWLSLPLFAALPHIPTPEAPEPGAPGPFAFGDKDRFHHILTDAGYRDIGIEPFDARLSMGRAEDPVEEALQQSLEIGPLSRIFQDLAGEQRARVSDAVREALAAHIDDGAVVLGGAVWLVTARA
ncbi:MAG: class I SAM-dependent methyltransferase [Parvibaculum sp.]|nr:class I SAM-dependent methyltransferase [Parvibaculum sp.]